MILSRRLTWKVDGIRHEADAKRAEKACDRMGLEADSEGFERPIVMETAYKVLDGGRNVPLYFAEATDLRAVAALTNYASSSDRPGIQRSVKKVCRDMVAPTNGSWATLKVVALYVPP